MSYRVVIRRPVQRMIVGWGLPDAAFVEVQLRLHEVLPSAPTQLLRRGRSPFEGMNYEFSFIDPANRLCVHSFSFLVRYGQDEQTLIIVNGGYLRQEGM